MDGDSKSEGAIPSLTCRVIQAFGGPKALQWGGMIQGVIHHESYTDPNKEENGTMPMKWHCIHGFIKAIGYGI
jgi:hypothetical protein